MATIATKITLLFSLKKLVSFQLVLLTMDVTSYVVSY